MKKRERDWNQICWGVRFDQNDDHIISFAFWGAEQQIKALRVEKVKKHRGRPDFSRIRHNFKWNSDYFRPPTGSASEIKNESKSNPFREIFQCCEFIYLNYLFII